MQIIPAAAPRQTFGSRLGAQVSSGLNRGFERARETAERLRSSKQNQAAQERENQAIAERFGIDLSGITNPDERKIIMKEALQGQMKQGLMGQKQDFLSKIFGGEQKQGQSQQQEGMQGQEENQMQYGFDPAKLTPEMILQAATLDNNLGRTLTHMNDVALREKRESNKLDFAKNKVRRGEETKISDPILMEMNQARKNIPFQEQAIEDIKEAAPNVSSLDYFADVTGFEGLRSSSGAKFKTGIKDFFLSDLTRAGARPNQWIEQQLMDALPRIGRSTEANLMVAEGMKFKVNLAKKRIEIIDDLSEKDREKYGYVKADVDARAYKQMQKYVVEQQKELKDSMKQIKADNKGKKISYKVRSPEGAVYEITEDDLEEAKKHGYELEG